MHPDGKAHGGSAIIVKSTSKYKRLEPISLPLVQAASVEITSINGGIVITALYLPRVSISVVSIPNIHGGGFVLLIPKIANYMHALWKQI